MDSIIIRKKANYNVIITSRNLDSRDRTSPNLLEKRLMTLSSTQRRKPPKRRVVKQSVNPKTTLMCKLRLILIEKRNEIKCKNDISFLRNSKLL